MLALLLIGESVQVLLTDGAKEVVLVVEALMMVQQITHPTHPPPAIRAAEPAVLQVLRSYVSLGVSKRRELPPARGAWHLFQPHTRSPHVLSESLATGEHPLADGATVGPLVERVRLDVSFELEEIPRLERTLHARHRLRLRMRRDFHVDFQEVPVAELPPAHLAAISAAYVPPLHQSQSCGQGKSIP